MKNILIISFICVAQMSFSQSLYDEDVVMKACSCIYNAESDSIDSIVNDCLIKALFHSLAEDGISKQKILQDYSKPKTISEYLNTHDQTTFGDYLEMLYKNCSATRHLIEKKQEKYYTMSDSEQANHYYLSGVNYDQQGKRDSALISYNKALTYDSLFVQALDNIGLLYGNMNEPDSAIRYSQKSLRIFPEGYTALLNLSAACLTKGEHDNAFSSYAKIIKYYPESPEGYFGLGLISFSDNAYETATRLMKHAYAIYSAQKSGRVRNCEEYLKASYYYMKAEGKDSIFAQIAGEFIPPVYQPEDFDKLSNMELNGEIDCRLAEPQILVCDNYILSTPVDPKNKNRIFATTAVRRWLDKTPDYVFHVDKDVAKILDREGNVLNVFIAAMTKFAIENPEQGNDSKAVALYAWNATLDYIANKENNIKQTGEIKKMIKARNNGTLEKQLGY
ncbi:MAG: tetratricopeptide repeat protein [Candidatus Azobacteroides sp.]|nr:tetratricopeptide repeat protein [Candidatus Azobacteroides sp.]